MGKKFLLSLFALSVLLVSAGSVFAETLHLLEQPLTEITTEGYNYRTKIYAVNDSGDHISNQLLWAMPFYKWYRSCLSDDGSLIIEAKLNPYDKENPENNTYIITANGLWNPEGTVLFASIDVSIDVTQLASNVSVDTFDDFITYTGSADLLLSPDCYYSVTLAFKEDSGTPFLKLPVAGLEDSMNLPLWLSYDVTSTDNTGTYVKQLRIFYKADADDEPRNDVVRAKVQPHRHSITDTIPEEPLNSYCPVVGSVRIDGATLESAADTQPVIGWDMTFENGIQFPWGSRDSLDLRAPMNQKNIIDIYYLYQNIESWDISPKNESLDKFNVSFEVIRDAVDPDGSHRMGEFELGIEPSADLSGDYSYDGTLTITDKKGRHCIIEVHFTATLPKLVISTNNVALAALIGEKDSRSVFFEDAYPIGYTLSPDTMPSGMNFTVTSDDFYITLAISPDVSGDYSGQIIFKDDFGNSVPATLSVKVREKGDPFSVTPEQAVINLNAGASTTFGIKALNNVGLVTWSVGTVPTGIGVSRSTTLSMTQDDVSPVFDISADITASGDYPVKITASDRSGASREVSLTVRVAGARQTDPVIRDLISKGYVDSTGTTLTDSAYGSGTDSSFISLGNTYTRVIVLNFPVSKWHLYIGSLKLSSSGFAEAADERGSIDPGEDKKSALITINRRALAADTDYPVRLGVVPEGSTYEVTGSLGSVKGGSVIEGVGTKGGCEAGFGVFVPLMAALFFIVKRRS